MDLPPLALLELVLAVIGVVLEHFHTLAGNSCDLPDHYGTSCSGHHLHSLIATIISRVFFRGKWR